MQSMYAWMDGVEVCTTMQWEDIGTLVKVEIAQPVSMSLKGLDGGSKSNHVGAEVMGRA